MTGIGRPYYQEHRRATCTYCEAAIDNETLFVPSDWIRRYRGQEIIDLNQACSRCFAALTAIAEAKAGGCRFSELDYERCACGNASPAVLGECVMCWRERRMLDRRAALYRANERLLRTLRKAIRDGDEDRRAA